MATSDRSISYSQLPVKLRTDEWLRSIMRRTVARVLVDASWVAFSLWIAFLIRFDGNISPEYARLALAITGPLVLVYIGANHLGGIYRQIWYLIGLGDSLVVLRSAGHAGVCVLVLNLVYWRLTGDQRIPVGVLVIHPVLVVAGELGLRFFRRSLRQRRKRAVGAPESPVSKRLMIAGAGQAGVALFHELKSRPGFEVVGFVDDNPLLIGKTVEGRPVLSGTDDVASQARRLGVDEVTLCMPSAQPSILGKIASDCTEAGLKVTTVPSLSDILLGRLTISRLRPIRMEELLSRSKVSHASATEDHRRVYRQRRILVTGAAGSIGSELARQLAECDPSELILLDKDENGIFELNLELKQDFPRTAEVVADIRNLDAMERVFQRYRPDVVFHAAAFKHVPLMESHPHEAVLNNIFGTKNVLDLCGRWGVSNFVLISTDKAVNPSSIMGASKRLAELVVQRHVAVNPGTKCCCVRFGNVLGSHASVVTIFQKQIREGKAITVTHPEMQRYFMTIPEAVQLVIQAGRIGENAETYVLDMGEPVKIYDLAKNLIRLSGLTPGKDVEIAFTGVRPGEKLYEELALESESQYRCTSLPKIFITTSAQPDFEELEGTLASLQIAAETGDAVRIHDVFRDSGIGYRPRVTEMSAVV